MDIYRMEWILGKLPIYHCMIEPLSWPRAYWEAAMTLLYTDPFFLKHDTGRHPEAGGRLRSISARLEKAGLIKGCTAGAYKPLSEEAVTKVHTAKQVQAIKQLAEQGGGQIGGDAVVCTESFHVGSAAAGACVAAVDAVLKGPHRTALCLVRPPGHHATATTSMGFCLFNNIALAASQAQTPDNLTRLLIVDWDVHHGNGTQDIFYENPQVMFFSIHRYGNGFYPGTGAESETGRGKGLGYTLNAPIRFGTPRKEYHARFTRALERAADTIKPVLVLMSAGFDAHTRNPSASPWLGAEYVAMPPRQRCDVVKTPR